MKRLESIEKDFANRLREATPNLQRAASLIACEIVVKAASLDIPIVNESLDELRKKDFLSEERINQLNEISETYDDKYLESSEDVAGSNEARIFFSKARAISALAFSGQIDPIDAAMESIYEALISVNDRDEINTQLKNVLSK